jgi:quercetin dioxygenase-like cupin family protein
MKITNKRKSLAINLLLTVLFINTALAGSSVKQVPTTLLDLSAMPSKTFRDGEGSAITLALKDEKSVLKIMTLKAHSQSRGAHATSDGNVRFVSVLSGVLYYGDGNKVDKSKETAYPAGSVLVISSGTNHWVSTREEPLVLMLSSHNPTDIIKENK